MELLESYHDFKESLNIVGSVELCLIMKFSVIEWYLGKIYNELLHCWKRYLGFYDFMFQPHCCTVCQKIIFQPKNEILIKQWNSMQMVFVP